jgi:SAM-dependent methyltransferase
MLERITRLLRRNGGHHALPPRDAYALWADNYPPRPHNPLMEIEQSVVEPMLAAAAAQWTGPSTTSGSSRVDARDDRKRLPRALDVGTGTGRYVPLLEAAGARVIVGIDMSIDMLGHNESRRPRVCGDACHLPFPDRSFDLVCSSLMAGDVEDLGSWIREAARVLAPGGHLVYSDFHPSWNLERWRRTFRTSDGRVLELSYFPHSIDEHLSHIGSEPLHIRSIREPRIPIRGRLQPVVVVFHAVKPYQPIVFDRC